MQIPSQDSKNVMNYLPPKLFEMDKRDKKVLIRWAMRWVVAFVNPLVPSGLGGCPVAHSEHSPHHRPTGMGG